MHPIQLRSSSATRRFLQQQGSLCSMFLTILALGVCSPNILQSAEITIILHSAKVDAFDSLVTIADIAEIKTSDKLLADRIGKLDLDELENDGEKLSISRQQVEMRILVSKHRSHNIRFRGETNVVITRVTAVHPAQVLKATVAKAIAEQFGIESKDIRVSLSLDSAPNLTGLLTNIEDTMVVLPANLPLGKSRVSFLYRNPSGNDQSLELPCRITILTEMAVAIANIPSGKRISEADIKTVKRPLEDSRLKPADIRNIVGMTSRSNIPVHGVVRIADLVETSNKILVKPNDFVDVVYNKGGLGLRMKNAKVLTSGAAGDRVEIMNPNSEKKVIASVISESLVEVR